MIMGMIRLCRLYYAIPMSLAYLLTVYYARGGTFEATLNLDVLSAGALAVVIAASYVLNDYFDRHVDFLNSSRRPIPAGLVSPRAAAWLGAGLLAAGLAMGAMCCWRFAFALTVVAMALVIYDAFSKRMGLLKPLLVGALMTSIYPLAIAQAGGATGWRVATLTVFPVWLFLTAFGYEVLKDIRDRRGDPAVAGRVTLTQRSPRAMRIVAGLAIGLAALLLVGPYLLGCGGVYMAVASISIGLGLWGAVAPIKRAIPLVYAECFIVGIAATADVLV